MEDDLETFNGRPAFQFTKEDIWNILWSFTDEEHMLSKKLPESRNGETENFRGARNIKALIVILEESPGSSTC
jgi:hypothetical protein